MPCSLFSSFICKLSYISPELRHTCSVGYEKGSGYFTFWRKDGGERHGGKHRLYFGKRHILSGRNQLLILRMSFLYWQINKKCEKCSNTKLKFSTRQVFCYSILIIPIVNYGHQIYNVDSNISSLSPIYRWDQQMRARLLSTTVLVVYIHLARIEFSFESVHGVG